MAIVNWLIGHYNRSGNAINSDSMNPDAGGTVVTNEYIKHATDLKWSMPLNGIDELEFSLYLDDPAALTINKMSSVIRIWRNINDTVNNKTRTAPAGTPDFCGIVSSVTKSGEENKMKVKAMNPLWLLQGHFHLLNHRLVTDSAAMIGGNYEGANGDELPWDHSALMFRLIDLTNGAFKNSGGDTGIRRPLTKAYNGGTTYWPKTVNVSPFFAERGSNTWANVFDTLMNREGSPDIVPEYIYTAASRNLMYFKTAIVRGTDRSATVSFDYRTGTKNLDDVSESSQVVPGTYGNFAWAVGDGGPNAGPVGTAYDPTDMSLNGIWMVREDVKGARISDVPSLSRDLLAKSLLSDEEIYEIRLAPLTPTYFGIDFFLGDLINFNASKGALSAANKKQRIYMVTLNYSDNNTETVDVQISSDFKRKYP